MDKSKLPKAIEFLTTEYLSKLLPKAPIEALVLPVLSKVAEILNHNRVTISNPLLRFDKVPPTINTIELSGSGTGKDRKRKELDRLTDFFEEKKEADFINAKKRYDEKVAKMAEAEHSKESQQKKYIAENQMRYLKTDITSESTPEGFVDQRSAFFDARVGCTKWVDSEIYDSIKLGLDPAFLKHNKEAFDHGESQDKTLKGSKKPRKFNVPHLVTIHGAIDDGVKEDGFKSFFDLGWGRRAMLVRLKDPEEYQCISRNSKKEMAVEALKNEDACRQIFKRVSDNVMVDLKYENGGEKEYSVSDDAADLYIDYEELCDRRAFDKRGIDSVGVVAENRHRYWKMMKVACLIAALEHDELVINKPDVEKAIFLTDYYGTHFEEFYFKDNVIIEDKIVEMFLRNGDVTKYDIKRQNFFSYDEFRQDMFLDNLFKMEDQRNDKGEVIGEVLEVKETLKWAMSKKGKEIIYRKENGVMIFSTEDFIVEEKELEVLDNKWTKLNAAK